MHEPSDISGLLSIRESTSKRVVRVKREPLSEETRLRIRAEIERTGIGPMRLLRGKLDKPGGLTSQMVESWMSGAVQSAVPGHVTFLLERWGALPTNRLMMLTPDMANILAAECRRTGMGPVTVLRRASDLPGGLTQQVIQTWVDQSTRKVSAIHWDYIMTRLRGMPDASGAVKSNFVRRNARQEIGADDLAELRRYRERTGIGGAILLRNASDKPAGLTPSMISSWLSGVAKTAEPGHVAYVLGRYRSWS
jgi:hypothetical protein